MLGRCRTQPLLDFINNPDVHVRRLKESGTREVLTLGDEPVLVVQSAASYQAVLDRLRELDDLVAVREGLAEAERGEGRSAREVFAELRARHGL